MLAAADLPAAISRAERRIRDWIIETPLLASPIGPHLKLENLQLTGSFKARGAFSRLLVLSDAERAGAGAGGRSRPCGRSPRPTA